MFTKCTEQSQSSPFFFAKAENYIVAEDKFKYADWFNNHEQQATKSLLSELIEADTIGSDVVIVDLYTTHHDEPDFFSVYEKDPSSILLYDVAQILGAEFFVFTVSGRPLTIQERELIASIIKKGYLAAADSIGALYVRLNIDGEISYWHNENSCFETCKLSPKERTPDARIARALKSYGINIDSFKDVRERLEGSENPLDSMLADIISDITSWMNDDSDSGNPQE